MESVSLTAALGCRLALVAAGSAAGGLLRYLVTLFVPSAGGFPFPTFAVNVLGSLAIGVLSGCLARCGAGAASSEALRAFLVVGFCGGFTTFSTFSNETFRLLDAAHYGLAAAYAALSLCAGLAAVVLGYFLSR